MTTLYADHLYADDPDVHRTYPITARQGDLNFDPVVKVTNMVDTTVTGEWVSAIGSPRDLKVPLAGLPANAMLFLRLLIPGDTDIELGYVVLE